MADKKALALSIDNAAICIENALQQILKPYPTGIYIKGNELPSIQPGDYCYRLDRLGRGRIKEIEVRTIDDVLGNVYNEDGEIIIMDRVAFQKERFLSTLPTVSAHGRNIVRNGIKDLIDYLQIYKNHHSLGSCTKHIQEVFELVINPNYHNSKTYRQYEDIVIQHIEDYIYPTIREWVGVGQRTWDVLIAVFDRDTVRIENNGDFRIHRYMEEHGQEHTNLRIAKDR